MWRLVLLVIVVLFTREAQASCADLAEKLERKGATEAEVAKKVEACISSNKQVHQVCDTRRSCKGVSDPKTATSYALKNEACIERRRRHSQQYFQNIDQGHALQVTQIQRTARECRSIASKGR